MPSGGLDLRRKSLMQSTSALPAAFSSPVVPGSGFRFGSQSTKSNRRPAGQLYGTPPGGVPKQIKATKGLRYADLVLDAARNRLICIREDHTCHSPKF